MPTSRPRVTLTETPDVARRLDLAAQRFPDRARSRRELLLALTEVAERALAEPDRATEAREAAKQRVLARTAAIGPDEAQRILSARDADWADRTAE